MEAIRTRRESQVLFHRNTTGIKCVFWGGQKKKPPPTIRKNSQCQCHGFLSAAINKGLWTEDVTYFHSRLGWKKKEEKKNHTSPTYVPSLLLIPLHLKPTCNLFSQSWSTLVKWLAIQTQEATISTNFKMVSFLIEQDDQSVQTGEGFKLFNPLRFWTPPKPLFSLHRR